MKWYRRLQDIWIWAVAIVLTVAGFCAFCAVVVILVIGARKLLME